MKHHAPAPGAWDFSETPLSSGRSVDFSEMLSPMAAAPAEFRIYGFHSDIGFHLGRGTINETASEGFTECTDNAVTYLIGKRRTRAIRFLC